MTKVQFECRMTGYDSEDSVVYITRKTQGTAPNININVSGKYEGHLEMDERCAEKIIASLQYILGKTQ